MSLHDTQISVQEKKSIDFFSLNQLTSTKVHMQGYLNHVDEIFDDDQLVAHFSLIWAKEHARNPP